MLVFNVEYGGTRATDAVLADLDADVVGVLESYNRLPEIAEAAGYPYYDIGLQVLSKYPILEPSGADGLYSFLEVRPGEAVAMINTHLDYVQDGPNRLERGVPVADVLATERSVRLASVETLLPSATGLLDEGWPVLFTGDLNEPSHLDWTAETADQHGGLGPVAWPVSEALTDAGLRDTYREAHPDPAADPGYTWGGVAGSGGSPRRIDFAYVGGPVEIATSELVGERGGEGVDRAYGRWTSDHRAVLSRLTVDRSRSRRPSHCRAAWRRRRRGHGDVPDARGLRRRHGHADRPVDGVVRRRERVGHGAGRHDLAPPRRLPRRAHRRRGRRAGRQRALRQADGRAGRATTDESRYAVGAPVTVSWRDGPANRWDWIGVYRAGAADPAKDDYLVWGYTGGHSAGALPPSTEGELVLGRDHQGRPWPLPPGRYVAHYLLTDQYVSAGSTTFVVR